MLIKYLTIGLGLSAALGPISSFIIWNRLAYLSDAIAHAALLGMVISILSGIDSSILMIMVSMVVSILLLIFKTNKYYSTDTLISIISQSLLAIGLVIASIFPESKARLSSFLFGDISTLTWKDAILIYLAAVAIITIVYTRWSSWITVSLNANLAKADGISVTRVQAEYTILLAIITSLAIKTVGSLLIVALLVISPATARTLARNPKSMVLWSTFICIVEIISGILVSVLFNTPAGPTIACTSFALFLLINGASWLRNIRHIYKNSRVKL
jgi:zinc transport system permease protein